MELSEDQINDRAADIARSLGFESPTDRLTIILQALSMTVAAQYRIGVVREDLTLADYAAGIGDVARDYIIDYAKGVALKFQELDR